MRLSYDNYNSKRALSSHTHVHTFYKNNAQQESRLSLAVVPTVLLSIVTTYATYIHKTEKYYIKTQMVLKCC